MWYVYLLTCDRRTYIGATTNPHRRLRQHNGEIVGGARSTRKYAGKWRLAAYLTGFKDRQSAYRWEKLIKLRSTGYLERLRAFCDVGSGVCPHGRKHYDVPDGIDLIITGDKDMQVTHTQPLPVEPYYLGGCY